MERQIKFRAKHIENGAWLYGDLLQSNEGSVYIGVHGQYIDDGYHFNDMYDETCYVDEDTIGQFTGLLDKNGKEIYEGDVILQQGYSGKKPMLVRFEHGAFIVGWHGGSSTATRPMLIQKRCEVLGNIYDNPELISKKQ